MPFLPWPSYISSEIFFKSLRPVALVAQIAAYISPEKYQHYPLKRWDSFKDSVYTSDKERVERLSKRYNFLGLHQVGPDGSTYFWLLVQHCDGYPAFQRAVLPVMNREVKKKETLNPQLCMRWSSQAGHNRDLPFLCHASYSKTDHTA